MIGGMNRMGLCSWKYIPAKSNCGLEIDRSPGKHLDHFDLYELTVNSDEAYRHEIKPRLRSATLSVLASKLSISIPLAFIMMFRGFSDFCAFAPNARKGCPAN